MAKLTEADIPLIRLKLSLGWSCERISKGYPVGPEAIHFIAQGRTWKHVK